MPIVDGLEQHYHPQLNVQRINANQGDGPTVMRHYQLLGHPTLLFIDAEGREQQRLLGPQDAVTVETAIQALLD